MSVPAPRRDQRVRPHHVEDARAAGARHRPRDGVRLPPHRRHARPGGAAAPEHAPIRSIDSSTVSKSTGRIT